ncbi:MAG TPA: response regulator [Nostocaceae cyanobacterium]|nr:response regulator [Nostocaceae cyanobacterium]
MNNQNLDKRTVLIADDDDDSREMLAFLLEQEGWVVKEAKDGQEAIEKVINEKPDLLILDNRMPEITGVEVYQELKTKGMNIPIVFATAYGYPEELATFLGVSYFITKPYDIPDLLSTIESAYTKAYSSS